MNIEYSGNSIISNKNSGLYLSKKDTASAPKIDFGNLLEKGKYYTLIMHDPDAVNDNHNVNHWVINNIQLTNTSEPLHKARQGLPLLDYKGPNPPPGSGIHKYIFTLYLQPNSISKNRKITLNKDSRSMPVSDLLDQLQLTNDNMISSVYFTSSASSIKKSRRRRKTRRQRKSRRL
jgi:phosphatidylethanolamine-binding protein (PEBP) family uncharacterized protein